jgi:anionic cell wall polymer biosynthesis LytR-Cps2A-Psr (LCP) family protein
MLKKIIAVIFFLLAIIACSFPFQMLINGSETNSSIKTGSDSSQDNLPTPFLPFIPSITPTPEGYLVSNALVPVNGLHAPSGQVNILILGSDYRPNSGFRTDVMVLVSILTKEQKVSIVSFPRDLFVDIPGFGQERINTSQEFGGFPLTKLLFEHDFGVHLDHYIMTNFNGFQSIVDMLGGIDINAASNLTDRCDLPYSHGGYC